MQRGRSHGGERAAHSRLVRTEVGRVLPHPQDPGDRSFDEVGDRCLAFDAAWKVFDLDRLAREKPDTPEALSRDEIKALYLLLIHQRIIPKRPLKPPDIRRDGYRSPRRFLAHQTPATPWERKALNVKLKHSCIALSEMPSQIWEGDRSRTVLC